jgi:hypothetical protein
MLPSGQPSNNTGAEIDRNRTLFRAILMLSGAKPEPKNHRRDHDRRGDADDGEEPEEDRLQDHWRSVSVIRRVLRDVLGDLALPAIAVHEQAFLIVIKLLARFGGEFEIRSLDDGIDRAGFLA